MIDPFDSLLQNAAGEFPTVVAFGGGLNSTAVLAMWVVLCAPPPGRILFADTGGERPATYDHVARFSDWLVSQGMPAIEVTRKGGRPETLEENCLRMGMLPSLAYGRKGCSHKFKIEPQERDINRWAPARDAWKQGSKVLKIIGYGYEEQRRIALAKLEDDKYWYRFPLNEWRMDRAACTEIIDYVGFPVPGKSSCFFCPASTKPEISALSREAPALLERALALEDLAIAAGALKTSKGLGRRFAWRDYLAGQAPAEESGAALCMYCIDQ